MRRCPLIILADSRTERVIGRIKLLIVSIITIKEVSGNGDPNGTKWVIIILNDVNQPFNISVIQIGKDSIIDNTMCLVGVNT